MPRGYKVVPYYDRTGLVYTTLHTVLGKPAAGHGAGLSGLDLFPRQSPHRDHRRDQHPLAMLGAFILLHLTETPANLLSLGRGRLRHHYRLHHHRGGEHLSASHHRGAGHERYVEQYLARRPGSRRTDVLFDADLSDRFLPLFTMQGVEGAIFSPMSHTYAYALIDRNCARRDAVAGALLLPAPQGDEGDAQLNLGGAFIFFITTFSCRIIALAEADSGGDYGDRDRRAFACSRAWEANSCPNWKKATSGRTRSCLRLFPCLRAPGWSARCGRCFYHFPR